MNRPSYLSKRLLVAFWPEKLKRRRSLASSSPKDILFGHRHKAGASLPEEPSSIIEIGKLVYYHGLSHSRPHLADISYDGNGLLGSSGFKPARGTLSRSRLRLEVFSFGGVSLCYIQLFGAVSFRLRKCKRKLVLASSSESRINLRRRFPPGWCLALSLAFKQRPEAHFREWQ